METALFSRRRESLLPWVAAVALALLMILADIYWPPMQRFRLQVDRLLQPVYAVVEVPTMLSIWGHEDALSSSQLRRDNAMLRQSMLVLQVRLQRFAAMAAENARLRGLMNTTVVVDVRVLLTEIIGLDPDPSRRVVLINKGHDDRVYVGQSVLDASGVMGQVIQVGANTSRVMLIADARAEVPVIFNRSGVRAIVGGYGSLDRLNVLYVPPSADVRPGDLLVTSGLGRDYPFGYPVAKVVRVSRKSGGDFADVQAVPVAALDRSSHLILLFSRPPLAQGGG